MRKFVTGLCASALAFAMTATSLVPVQAAPVYAAPPAAERGPSNVIQIQKSNAEIWREKRLKRRNNEARRDFRRDRREARRDWRRDRREARRDFYRDRPGYYRGHRGYRDYRPGYRRHGDYWYPAAAFIAGAVVGGAIANSQPRVVVRGGESHTQWCYNRYRSYRASDNTFQPYGGPRQQCISPY
jgi:hypothetical protein